MVLNCKCMLALDVQEDIQAAGRRLSGLEASVAAQVPECLMLSRRMAARQADAETRSSTLTAKVGLLESMRLYPASQLSHLHLGTRLRVLQHAQLLRDSAGVS